MTSYEEEDLLQAAIQSLKGLQAGYESMHRSEMERCQMREQDTIPAQLALLELALAYDGSLTNVPRAFREGVLFLASNIMGD